MSKKTVGLRILLVATSASVLSSCAPLIVGGGATLGTAAMKEKGVSGAMSDSQISTQIRFLMYQENIDLHQRIEVSVQNGEVLLVGTVTSPQMQLDANRIAWSVNGVKRVIDNIKVASEDPSITTYAKDSWITTQVKTALLMDKNVRSINYGVHTVDGVVYLMGIAQDEKEHKIVTTIASRVRGVKRVESYVRLKNKPGV